MPTYKYRREDGSTFTVRQKITEDALEECPDTGQPVERVITGGMGFQLKGGGWYEDGYTRPEAAEESNGASGEEASGENASGEGASGREAQSESAGAAASGKQDESKQDES